MAESWGTWEWLTDCDFGGSRIDCATILTNRTRHASLRIRTTTERAALGCNVILPTVCRKPRCS
jgi:hypothetical protein